MAFNFLQGRITKALKNVQKRAILSEENIAEVLNEIRVVLLESDVNLKVVDDFIADIRKKSVGEVVGMHNTSSQLVLKIINEELVNLLGKETKEWKVEKPDTVMLVGLQGSGKTTTIAKISKYLNKNKGYSKPLLVGLDIYRPAAIDQLETLAKSLHFDFYSDKNSKDVKSILEAALLYAKAHDNDLIMLDTAGRLQTDEKLMQELEMIKHIAKPSEILFTVDAMSGQEMVNVATEFNNHIKLTGMVITKMDSEAKGGSSLSIRALLNIPILFVGTGEKVDNIELFHPNRMASRILGLGDIETLTEMSVEVSDEKKQEKMFRKMMTGNFDLNDLLDSMHQMKKMGNMSQMMKLIPGLNLGEDKMNSIENKMKAYTAIVSSMTKKERKNAQILGHPKRKERILKGSGRTIQEYNELLRQFERSQKQIKELIKHMKAGRIPNLNQGGFGNMGF